MVAVGILLGHLHVVLCLIDSQSVKHVKNFFGVILMLRKRAVFRRSAVFNLKKAWIWRLLAGLGSLFQVEFCNDAVFVDENQRVLEVGFGLFLFEWEVANLSLCNIWTVFSCKYVIQKV